MKTQRALLKCLEWLRYCLEIGWDKGSVNGLEKLWWQYHDDNGKLNFNK